MNILYIVFGQNYNNHLQASFSIYSFLACNSDINSINVVTDSPEFYTHLHSQVQIIPVDEQLLNKWKGAYNFFWRIKIVALYEVTRLYPNQPVIYVDTDTFCYSDSGTLKKILVAGNNALMHEDEGSLSVSRFKTEKSMWKNISGNTYGGIQINDKHKMWNAGVVATPNTKNSEDIALALQICDDMCAAGITPRLIEQFSLSVALEEQYGLKEARNTIAHYWSNKTEWNEGISAFFCRAYFMKLSFEEIKEKFKEFDYQKIAIKRKERKTKLRLINLVEQIFADKNVSFLKG